MALKINRDYILTPADEHYIPKAECSMPEVIGITIHNTANVAKATGEVDYMKRNPADEYYVSFHYAVDNNEAVQGVELDRATWNASDGYWGTGNRKTISIEICYSYVNPANQSDEAKALAEKIWHRDYQKLFEASMKNAAELSAMLLKKYWGKCDLNRMYMHHSWSAKVCPHRILSDYSWEYFLDLVEEKYEDLYPEDYPMTKKEQAAFEKLQKTVEKLSKELTEAKGRLAEYDAAGVYDNAANRWGKLSEVPSWGKGAVEAALRTKGVDGKPVLRGDGSDLNLSKVKLENLTFLQRTGNTK